MTNEKVGAPRKEEEDLRVPITMTVKKETKKFLSRYPSRGVMIDYLVAQEMARLERSERGKL